MVCEQVRVVGMQSQAAPMEVLLLLLGTTPTAHPPRWLLLLQPPMTLASSVDKQAIGHVIAQVSAIFARVVLQCMLSCMLQFLCTVTVRRDIAQASCCPYKAVNIHIAGCI